MQIVSANVLDKNEKCVNFVEMTVPDEVELTTAKALFQKMGQPYHCRQCSEGHGFEGALFAHQKVIAWNGETEETPKGKVAVSREWSKPLGEDEFTIKVTGQELP